MKKRLNTRKGQIALITLLILLGVGTLGLGMVITSQLSSASANNYRYKIQTYNAADGIMTLLAQDVLDFNDSKYFSATGPLDSLNANTTMGSGNTPAGGSYTYNAGTQTLIGGGSDIQGTSDNMRFAYNTMSGDCNLTVKVVSMTNPNGWAKAGIMIRQSLNSNSQYVMAIVTPGNGVTFQSRKTAGGSTNQTIGPSISAPVWLQLMRTGNIFKVAYSLNDVSWTTINKDTISMTDPVFAGLGVTSHTTSLLCTAVFSSFAGLSSRSFTDTVKVGKDSIPVIYSISQLGSNLFSMSTDSYLLKGTSNGRNYETHLTQVLSREASGQWHETVHDSAFVPVTFYDFRGDMSNPEFNVGAAEMPVKNMVQDGLDAQRKPIPTSSNGLRICMLNWYGNSWYSLTPDNRLNSWVTARQYNIDHPTTFTSCISNNIGQGWCFSDSLKWWFRPRGATGATFDSLNNVWRNLKHRWNGTDSVANEYVGINYDPNDQFANIVIYDTLTFRETGTNTGIFTFGDSLNAVTKDTQWFVSNSGYEFPHYKFMPLKNKGYKFDAHRRYTAAANPCKVYPDTSIQNFSFTMEMHRLFTYKPGQTFYFSGDDDVWTFINNRLVIDLGGMHSRLNQLVNLDTVGNGVSNPLVSGQEYWFDFFYCERNVCTSNILITTNMMFYIPPQPTKRSWKRDYGNLD